MRRRPKRELLGDDAPDRDPKPIDLDETQLGHQLAHDRRQATHTHRHERAPGLAGAGEVKRDELAAGQLGHEWPPHLQRRAEAFDQQQRAAASEADDAQRDRVDADDGEDPNRRFDGVQELWRPDQWAVDIARTRQPGAWEEVTWKPFLDTVGSAFLATAENRVVWPE